MEKLGPGSNYPDTTLSEGGTTSEYSLRNMFMYTIFLACYNKLLFSPGEVGFWSDPSPPKMELRPNFSQLF